MSLYGKIFSSMYDGSLYGQWEAIVTFQQMIVLSDHEGFVDMTPQAMSARTSIPLDIIKKGIEILLQPDKYSRSPECDGRRIELVDVNRPWGWRIVNHATYRKMASSEEKRESDRLRIAAKREAERGTETFHVNGLSHPVADSRDLSLEVANVAYAECSNKKEVRVPDRFPDFWRTYPRKVGKGEAKRAWDRRKCNQQADEIIGHVSERATTDAQWLEDAKFIPYPATWINREGWLDEYAKTSRPRIDGL